MKILVKNFNKIENENDQYEKVCFCGCDWKGCDCEYNCFSDDDCTSDTDR